MAYLLKQYDTNVAKFDMFYNDNGFNIKNIELFCERLLPLDMTFSEEGIKRWLKHRSIPKNRIYVDRVLSRSGLSHNNTNINYSINDYGFTFTFYRKNVTLNVTENVTLNKNANLKTNDYKVLNILKENGNQTREQIASRLGIDKRTVQRCLDRLVNAEYISRVGSKKTGFWEIIK